MSRRVSARRPRLRVAPGVALVLSAAIACRDSTAPASAFAGDYVLRQVGAHALPAVLYSNEHVRLHALADTLRLRADGRGAFSRLQDTELLQGQPALVFREHVSIPLGFRAANGRLEIWFDCSPNANCAPPPHLIARPVPGGLRVVNGPAMGLQEPLQYERIGVHD